MSVLGQSQRTLLLPRYTSSTFMHDIYAVWGQKRRDKLSAMLPADRRQTRQPSWGRRPSWGDRAHITGLDEGAGGEVTLRQQ